MKGFIHTLKTNNNRNDNCVSYKITKIIVQTKIGTRWIFF